MTPAAPILDEFDWGRMEWFMDDRIAESPGVSLARMTVRPGKASPAHIHDNCEETLTCVAGVIRVEIDGEAAILSPGQSLVARRNSVHASFNDAAEPAVMMLAWSSGARNYQDARDDG
jgi:quercetin dioxygenase-like cupin family protein